MSATYPKNGLVTKEEQTAGSKVVKAQLLRFGQAADLGPAPTARVYSRDYSKKDMDGDQYDDTLSQYIGNPLGL